MSTLASFSDVIYSLGPLLKSCGILIWSLVKLLFSVSYFIVRIFFYSTYYSLSLSFQFIGCLVNFLCSHYKLTLFLLTVGGLYWLYNRRSKSNTLSNILSRGFMSNTTSKSKTGIFQLNDSVKVKSHSGTGGYTSAGFIIGVNIFTNTYDVQLNHGSKEYSVTADRLSHNVVSRTMKRDIATYDKKFANTIPPQFSSWEWEESSAKWKKYDNAISFTIDTAFKNGKVPCEFRLGNYDYVCAFESDGTGHQMNKRTGKRRAIKRVGDKPKMEKHQIYAIETEDVLDGIDTPENKEYNFAMGQFLKLGNKKKIVRVDVYRNEKLTKHFEEKKLEFQNSNKSTDACWVFHGTEKRNVSSIFDEGFKVGGINGHSIKHGSAYGRGVYTAIGPQTPELYSKNSKQLILSKGLLGKYQSNQRSGKTKTGQIDSWSPKSKKDWRIFKDSAQLLPLYVIHYK